MDAKSRADFINSTAAGQIKVCPICQSGNNPDAAFCSVCGRELKEPDTNNQDILPFTNVDEEIAATQEDIPYIKPAIKNYHEPDNIFAKGLPEWSIEPPNLLVRRKL
ncbi:MAG: zinc ribbon domain-containing protein [Lachnospiraceae bacterium]|nr:zinc ribbon domain-containing protein [Lachnospiraceae bacterium]